MELKQVLVPTIALTGMHAGALLFVSTVSARVLMHAVEQRDSDLIQRFFPVWWPAGRDLMAPLGAAAAAANFYCYYRTRQPQFSICGGAMLGIILWTGLVMGENIQELREGSTDDVLEVTRSFCWKHHVRTVVSGSAFLTLLYKTFA
ncbi:hypothetical protein QOT17_013876 [Balamuthia mandrillaris]